MCHQAASARLELYKAAYVFHQLLHALRNDALGVGGCGLVGQVVLLCSGALDQWVLLLCPRVSQ